MTERRAMVAMEERQIIREAVLDALRDHGLCTSACKLTDDDVAFFKRAKRAIDTLATGIGMAIILGILGVIGWFIRLGVEGWKNGGGNMSGGGP